MSQRIDERNLFRNIPDATMKTLPDRLMAGRWVLVPEIGVRVPVREPERLRPCGRSLSVSRARQGLEPSFAKATEGRRAGNMKNRNNHPVPFLCDRTKTALGTGIGLEAIRCFKTRNTTVEVVFLVFLRGNHEVILSVGPRSLAQRGRWRSH